LRVNERLPDLVPLDLVVEDTRSSEPAASDEEGLVFESESFGGEDIVREEDEHDDSPEYGDAAEDEEDGSPDGDGVDLPDAKC
jgi:hypothetical protein